MLIFAGFAVHHWWVTSWPLAAGDWGWLNEARLGSLFPWPTIWDPFVGFGIKNFPGSNGFPIEAIASWLGVVGVGWSLAEKAVYYWPFAALSFFAAWLFARNILGSSRWAVLSALIFASNTYLLIVSTGGQLTVAMAEVLAPLVLWSFVRTLRRLSIADALLCGLLAGLQAAYEVRIAYLTALVSSVYLFVLLLNQPSARILGRRLGLAALVATVLTATQLSWLVPLLSYTGDRGLPISNSPWVAFMRISHAITAVHPFWTGGAPTVFQTVAVAPVFFLFPLISFAILLKRRPGPEALWLCLVSLIAAFLIKQNNPPFGGVYDWFFYSFPGGSLFREASKLFFIVGLSYAVLVPMSLRHLAGLIDRPRRPPRPVKAVQVETAPPIRVHPLQVGVRSFDVYVTEQGLFQSEYEGRWLCANSRRSLYSLLMRATRQRRLRFEMPTVIYEGKRLASGLVRSAAQRLYGLAQNSYERAGGAVAEWLANNRQHLTRFRARLPRAAATAGILAITAICLNNLGPALIGQLGFTTQPIEQPSSFRALTKIIEEDRGSGEIFWLGGASVGDPASPVQHHFPVATLKHPLLELSGFGYSNDVLTRYCRSTLDPFCYLDGDLFPYLLSRLGGAFVIAPAGSHVGALPKEIAYGELLARLANILGPPRIVGSGPEALAVWHLAEPAAPVTISPAIALVDGSVQITQDVSPALQVLGVPAIYRSDQAIPLNDRLPGPSIEVIPGFGGWYIVRSGGAFALMARGAQASLRVWDGNRSLTLPRLVTAATGWSVYGQMDLQEGAHRLVVANNSLQGPLIEWSSAAGNVLTTYGRTNVSPTSLQPERLVVPDVPPGPHWIELRRTYDSGWSLTSSTAHLPGDSLFNLYWAPKAAPTVTFSFASTPWETLGKLATIIVAVMAILLWLLMRHRPRPEITANPSHKTLWLALPAFQMAVIAVALLALAAVFQLIGWWGLAWLLPHTSRGTPGDPFALSELYIALSMLAIGASITCHLVDEVLQERRLLRWLTARRPTTP